MGGRFSTLEFKNAAGQGRVLPPLWLPAGYWGPNCYCYCPGAPAPLSVSSGQSRTMPAGPPTMGAHFFVLICFVFFFFSFKINSFMILSLHTAAFAI